MVQHISIAALLALGGWCLYVRRGTWRCGLKRVLTLSVVFIILGILLTAPFLNPYDSVLLEYLVGIRHFDDFLGHLCFISAICAIIYALLYRLVPDRTARRLLLRRAEIPSTASAAVMLLMETLSDRLDRSAGPWYWDFFDVPCGPYLAIYWTVYASLCLYLLGYMTRLLWVLRRDPRSRRTADLYLLASIVGIVAAIAMYVDVWVKFMNAWVWLLIAVGCGLAVAAAGVSWLRDTPSALDDTAPTPPSGSQLTS